MMVQMNTRINRSLLIFVLAMSVPCAHALGPIDGEIGAVLWADNASIDDLNNIGLHGQVWIADKWGLQGGLYSNDLDNGLGETDYFNIDVYRRWLSLTDHNYIAFGLGWEDIDIGSGLNISGPRLSIKGQVGLGSLISLYGHSTWLPSLDDATGIRDPNGLEVEAGLQISPFPFLSLRAGYRKFDLDFKSDDGSSNTSSSSGLILGGGIHW